MSIRKSRLAQDPPPPEKKPLVPIEGLAEINSGVDAIAEGLNVLMRDHKKLAGKMDVAKPDGWSVRVVRRNPATREIEELVLRPIYDTPGKVN